MQPRFHLSGEVTGVTGERAQMESRVEGWSNNSNKPHRPVAVGSEFQARSRCARFVAGVPMERLWEVHL